MTCRSNQWCNTSLSHSPDRIELTQITAKSLTLETISFKKKYFLSSFTCCCQKTARSANIYEGPSWPGFTKGYRKHEQKNWEETQARTHACTRLRCMEDEKLWYRIKNRLWWWWLMHRECLWCLPRIDAVLYCPLVRKCFLWDTLLFYLTFAIHELLILKLAIHVIYLPLFWKKYGNFSFCLTS